MNSITSSLVLPVDIGDGLRLRLAANADDIQRVLRAHITAFGPEDRALFEHHLLRRPFAEHNVTLLVEDKSSHDVVSSLDLIPETWTIEGAPVQVAELGVISTVPAYRHRGLVRRQFQVAELLARRMGCLWLAIQGIPYFYRQFGFDYLLPLGGGWRLPADLVPETPSLAGVHLDVRPADLEGDMPCLQRMYSAAVDGLCVASDLNEAIWRYQEAKPKTWADRQTTYIVESERVAIGFVRLFADDLPGRAERVRITGAHAPDHQVALAILRFARKLALEDRKEPIIEVHIPISTPLTRLIEELGGKPRGCYAWQIKTVDPVRVILAMAPAFARRLAASDRHSLDTNYVVNLYTHKWALRIRAGRLASVIAVREPPSNLSCPASVFTMLLCGHRSLEELLDWYPDVRVKDEASRALGTVLFPRRSSWVWSLV